MDRTAAYYSSPTYKFGAGYMPVFSGSRRQKGGSIFGAMKNLFMPVLNALGKKIVKRGAHEAIGLAKDVALNKINPFAGDLNMADEVRKRAVDVGRFAAAEGLDSLEKMIGSGRRHRRRYRSRHISQGSRNLRKRKLSKRRSKSRPTKKRRRRRRQKSKANF